jgi:hypothetical protein
MDEKLALQCRWRRLLTTSISNVLGALDNVSTIPPSLSPSLLTPFSPSLPLSLSLPLWDHDVNLSAIRLRVMMIT